MLRPPRLTDAPVIAAHLNNYDICKWLTMVPFPYGLSDAESFVQQDMGAHLVWADDQFVGVISTKGSLGYWLTESAWDQGYATEAGRAKLADHFRCNDNQMINSSYFVGNAASCNVLTKLGFIDVGKGIHFSKSRQAEVAVRNMELTRARWEASQHA
ncbi:MAG: GNAT family N-acetyltransferase [Pseudomonadota bacterium]